MKNITVPAHLEQLSVVLDFVKHELETLDCPIKIQAQIAIAVEEIFVNISNYAYQPHDGDVTLTSEIKENPLQLILTFIDSGIPYNPLEKVDPDITLPVDQREIGGLGIYMVKKSMDFVDYKYENNKNIFTLIKYL